MKNLYVNFDYFVENYKKLKLTKLSKFKNVIKEKFNVNKYSIKTNTDLWFLAMELYGSGRYADSLKKFNEEEYDIKLNKTLLVGDKLYYPERKVLEKYLESKLEFKDNKDSIVKEDVEILNPLLGKHVVKQGENLPNIAFKYYNDKTYYKELALYNNILNISLIRVGTRLDIPYLVDLIELRNNNKGKIR